MTEHPQPIWSRVSVLWLRQLCPGLFTNAPQTVNAPVILHVDIMCKREPKSISHERCSGNLPTWDLEGFLQISPERAEIAFFRGKAQEYYVLSHRQCESIRVVVLETLQSIRIESTASCLWSYFCNFVLIKKPGRHAVRFTTLVPKMSVRCVKHK